MLLIVNTSEKSGNAIAEIFHYMGIISVQKKPHDALSEICTRYSAVLICEPQAFPDPRDYMHRLRSYGANIPMFALVVDPSTFAYEGLFDGVFPEHIFSSSIATAMIRYCQNKHIHAVGDYRLAGIDATPVRKDVIYFGAPLHLTKTEAMIVRFLIRCFPNRSPTKDVLRYAYRPSRSPDPSNIRTHVSIINKKARALTGRNLIDLVQREGYRIVTPILFEEKKRSESHTS